MKDSSATSDREKKLPETHAWPFEANLAAAYDPQYALERILEHLTKRIPCEAAYLAIRYGDTFQIRATWN